MKGPTPWHSSEASEKYNSLFPLLPNYAARYTFGGKLGPKIGLPDKNSLYLIDEILTLLIADRLQVSYATAKKRYPPEVTESRWLGLTDRIDTIFSYGRTRFSYYVSLLKDRPQIDGSYQDPSIQFFYRSLATFDASDAFVTQVNTYSDDVCKILKLDTVLGKMDMLVQELCAR